VLCFVYARTSSASGPLAQSFLLSPPHQSAWSQRKRPGVCQTPGLMAHLRVGPSVIIAYIFRSRARSFAVHSPVGQMLCTAAPSAISVWSLVLSASFESPLALLYPMPGQKFRFSSIRVSDRRRVRATFEKSFKFGHRENRHRARLSLLCSSRVAFAPVQFGPVPAAPA